MKGNQEFLLLAVIVFGWLVGAIFVGAVASTYGGVTRFFGWFFAALLVSPPLAAVLLVASLVQELDRHLQQSSGEMSDADESTRPWWARPRPKT
jgi:TRAP-type C4-dicarboxylate transport system permease small subunit